MIKYYVNPETKQVEEKDIEEKMLSDIFEVDKYFNTFEAAQEAADKIIQTIIESYKGVDKVFENGGSEFCNLAIDTSDPNAYAYYRAVFNILNKSEFGIGEKRAPSESGAGIYISDNLFDCKRAFIEAILRDKNVDDLEFQFPEAHYRVNDDVIDDLYFDRDVRFTTDGRAEVCTDDDNYYKAMLDSFTHIAQEYAKGETNEFMEKDFKSLFTSDSVRINKFEKDGKTVYAIVLF